MVRRGCSTGAGSIAPDDERINSDVVGLLALTAMPISKVLGMLRATMEQITRRGEARRVSTRTPRPSVVRVKPMEILLVVAVLVFVKNS